VLALSRQQAARAAAARELGDPDRAGRSDTGVVDFRWPAGVRADPAVMRAYVEVTSLWPGRCFSALALLAGVAAIVLGLRWRRARASRYRGGSGSGSAAKTRI
jgi:hypothetical protein